MMDFLNNLKQTFSTNMTLKSLFNYISTPIGMYIVWIFLHYGAAHLYQMHCAPSGFWGFILSPLMASTPYCTGLVWILQNSVIKFMAIWTIFGSWVSFNLNKTNITHSTNNEETKKDEETKKED